MMEGGVIDERAPLRENQWLEAGDEGRKRLKTGAGRQVSLEQFLVRVEHREPEARDVIRQANLRLGYRSSGEPSCSVDAPRRMQRAKWRDALVLPRHEAAKMRRGDLWERHFPALAERLHVCASPDAHSFSASVVGNWTGWSNCPDLAVVDVAFDATCDLVASVTAGGALTVHDAVALAHAARAPPVPGTPVGRAEMDPVVALGVGGQASALTWDPVHRNTVAVALLSAAKVSLFDLEYCETTESSAVTVERRGAGVHRREGLTALSFFPEGGSGGNVLCAATTCCSVACWDRRAGKGHQAELTASARGECDPSLSAVTVSADGTLVAAGGGAGRVHIWDIRKASVGGFSGANQRVYGLLQSVAIPAALTRVRGLLAQTRIPLPSIHDVVLEGSSSNLRALFHLGCGWTGALMVETETVTNLNGPPCPAFLTGHTQDWPADHGTHQDTPRPPPGVMNVRRRRICHRGDAVAVPCADGSGVFLVDLARGVVSATAVDTVPAPQPVAARRGEPGTTSEGALSARGAASGEAASGRSSSGRDGTRRARGRAPAAKVVTQAPVCAVSQHSAWGQLVCGTARGEVAWVAPRRTV